ncbi:Probable beta-1-3-galactosyltransferase 19 [Striga hermonthica]|uniref:Galectin n=1 Tax=Striga hermonthica TaxID=68872 RepID=A0A9N7N826_STRHE|nr:Probable beta-1-3-galactosyltransferase 19 [Striga hermonthica]
MKRSSLDLLFSVGRQRSTRVLILFALLYIILVCFEVPFVFKNGFSSVSQEGLLFSSGSSNGILSTKPFLLESEEDTEEKEAPVRPLDLPYRSPERKIRETLQSPLSRLNLTAGIANSGPDIGISKAAKDALEIGRKLWRELESAGKNGSHRVFGRKGSTSTKPEPCPHSISVGGEEFLKNGKIMVLPCGLTLGSHMTVVGKPRVAHAETDPKISLLKEGQYVMVSQFMMELQGLKTVEDEDPPRILHFNPRLKGDWSGKPVIEHNTCYRMQWGTSQRCEGWKSRADEETGKWEGIELGVCLHCV